MFSGVPSFVQGFGAESAGRTRCPVLGMPSNKADGGSPAFPLSPGVSGVNCFHLRPLEMCVPVND